MNDAREKRWIWDLYPLAKDSWGAWEIEPNQERPDHRVYLYRRSFEGYLGPVVPVGTLLNEDERRQMAGMVVLQNIIHREGYVPTEKDFALLLHLFPWEDPHKPAWGTIEKDLFLACPKHVADKLVRTKAPILLGLLEKAKRPVAGPSNRKTPRLGQGKARPGGKNARKESTRRSLSPGDQAKVLEKCRRRCCVCFMLNHDDSEKKGHLAHLDHDRSNNAVSNSVWLCLIHHDTYDSKTSQAKNLTEKEVRLYQAKLHQAVERGEVP